jgi:hypothetical protein
MARHGSVNGTIQAAEAAVWSAPSLSESMSEDDRWNYRMRGETPNQRLDRNFGELLQEVRVAQVGVQALLAFLLAVAFTPRFGLLTVLQRDAYVTSLVLGAGATALLIAPAAFHRVVFRRRLKREMVRACSRLALVGLILMMLSISMAMLLILDVVLDLRIALWLSGGLLCWFSLWWYVLPLRYRWRARPRVVRRH